jgi:hypothetical protein
MKENVHERCLCGVLSGFVEGFLGFCIVTHYCGYGSSLDDADRVSRGSERKVDIWGSTLLRSLLGCIDEIRFLMA